MNPRRSILVLAVLLAGAAVIGWAAMRHAYRADAQAPREAASSGEKVSLRFFRNPEAVPSFTVRDLDGRVVSAADWRGKVTLINFWATWCGPCRREIPDLVALQQKYHYQLQIIGVSEDEDPLLVKQFRAEQKINYPVVMMTPELERMFPGVNALPTTFVLDREGRIVQKHVGLLDRSVTELETRALAGLSVNASIEQVDRVQAAHLENAAQATTIPGVDLAVLKPEQRAAALKKLNTDACTCGCDLTVAKCRIDDPTCGVSLPLAQQIVKAIVEGR
jgi:thiol-disulfide isomerase/thioredoxin